MPQTVFLMVEKMPKNASNKQLVLGNNSKARHYKINYLYSNFPVANNFATCSL